MGGRFPMAGQTTSSWPSAKTLQRTKNMIFPTSLGHHQDQIHNFNFFFIFLKLWLWEQHVALFVPQFLLWFEFKLQVTGQNTSLFCLSVGN